MEKGKKGRQKGEIVRRTGRKKIASEKWIDKGKNIHKRRKQNEDKT